LREGSRLTKDSQTARGQTLASTCCTAQLTASLLIEFQSLRGGLQSADAQTRNHLPLPYLEHRLHNLNNLVLACELKPVPIEIQPTLECFLNT